MNEDLWHYQELEILSELQEEIMMLVNRIRNIGGAVFVSAQIEKYINNAIIQIQQYVEENCGENIILQQRGNSTNGKMVFVLE